MDIPSIQIVGEDNHDPAHSQNTQPTHNNTHQQQQQQINLALIIDEVDFDAYDDEELKTLHEELSKKVTFMDIETELFDSYYERVNKSGVSGGNNNINNNNTTGNDVVNDEHDNDGKNNNNNNNKKRKGKVDKNKDQTNQQLMLSSEQKAEIAGREIEEFKDYMNKQKQEWIKHLDHLKAEVEEMDIRLNENKKEFYEFKREVASAVNNRTGKVAAEKIVRYFEEKIRNRETTIEKTRLKNATLKTHKNKLASQLKQKEEMGEVLHAIDFDQLQIENKQYLAKIEERNNELLKLKMAGGRTVQVLNYYKKKLNEETKSSTHLRQEIQQRNAILRKLRSEASLVSSEKDKATKQYQQMKELADEFKVPSVLDYVTLKSRHYEMNKKLKSWERKSEIATMQLQRLRTLYRQTQIALAKTRNRSYSVVISMGRRSPTMNTDVDQLMISNDHEHHLPPVESGRSLVGGHA